MASAAARRGKRGRDVFTRADEVISRINSMRNARSKSTFKAIYKRMRSSGHSKPASTQAAFYHTTKTAGANSRMGRAFSKYMNRKHRKSI
jgi:hypothetical protein